MKRSEVFCYKMGKRGFDPECVPIAQYRNRKLYDFKSSKYTNAREILERVFVKKEKVRVYLIKSGEVPKDITEPWFIRTASYRFRQSTYEEAMKFLDTQWRSIN